jgi:hypothetical protein
MTEGELARVPEGEAAIAAGVSGTLEELRRRPSE